MKREHFDLFLGVGRGELVPYEVYYLTGFLNERPLARLRQDMKHLGLQRAEGHCDPEDHLGTLCEIMSGFAAGRFEAQAGEQGELLHPPRGALGRPLLHRSGEGGVPRFYRPVGTLGRVFIDIETEGFAMETRQSA